MAIAAAAGYPQYSGSLIPPLFSQDLIERFYSESIFGSITTTEYTGELKQKGDQITFFRKPKVEVRKATKDGTIKHDTIDTCPITMTIDNALEFSIKMSQMDTMLMTTWAKWESAITESASNQLTQIIDVEVLTSMAVDADPANKGNVAGIVSGLYNQGAPGAPVNLTAANIWEYLTRTRAVLKEQRIPTDDLWIALPDAAEPLLLNSPHITANAGLAGACCTVASDGILNGKLPTKIAGFTVYITPNLEGNMDAGTGQLAYSCIAGFSGAMAFASQIERTRMMKDSDKDSWDNYIQGLSIYGYKAILPEGLAVLYAQFN